MHALLATRARPSSGLKVRRRATPSRFPLGACLLSLGCSSILDIDGHYVSNQKGGTGGRVHDAALHPDAQGFDTGGTAEGGAGGTGAAETGGAETGGIETGGTETGGTPATTGGAPGAGGMIGTGGDSCTDTSCGAGFKCCGSQSSATKACYQPGPLVGCGDTGCDHCANAIPDHATAACAAKACSFTCDPGFKAADSTCVAMGTGGKDAGGASSGGAGGASGCTKDRDCPKGCGPAGPFGCCLSRGVCGCTFFNLELGGAGAIDLGYCLPRPPGI